MNNPARFWSEFAARYDGHVLSRDAEALIPRVVAAVGPVERVLDAGCGTGQIAVELARVAKQVDAVDFVEPMLAIARRKAEARGLTNVRFQQMEVDCLSFAAASFDAVVLSNVMHLIADPPKALSEARRVLKPGGRLVAPSYCHGEGLKTALLSRTMALLFGVPVLQRFGIEKLLGMVETAGFKVAGREVVTFKVPLAFIEAVAV